LEPPLSQDGHADKHSLERQRNPFGRGNDYYVESVTASEILSELVPAVQLIAARAIDERSLTDPILEIMAWMRGKSIETDSSGFHRPMLMLRRGKEELTMALERHPEADFALNFQWVNGTPDKCSFWEQVADREGRSNSQKHERTAEQIRAKGFMVGFDCDSNQINEIGIEESWMSEHGCEFVCRNDCVFLFRHVQVSPTSPDCARTSTEECLSPRPRASA
jgi:hypothetical protein